MTMKNGIVRKYKTKIRRRRRNANPFNNTCPVCMSPLILNKTKRQECSGQRLNLWVNSFKQFENLDENEKSSFLDNFEHPNIFLELYKKWEYKDVNGHRTNFTCSYTGSTNNTVSRLSQLIPDPVQVKYLEDKIGRKLTNEELDGKIAIILEDIETYVSKIKYPDDVI